MRPIVLAIVLASSLLADPSARMTAMHARKDFDLTADPNSAAWKRVPNIRGAFDPFGKPAAAGAFDFRVQWTQGNLYFLFICPFDQLNLKPNPTTEETNKLWEWDVTEIFIGHDPANIGQYKELQVSPQGEWVDLDIDRKAPKPEGGWKWNSGMTVKARIDREKKIWYGEMKIPFSALDPRAPKAGSELRINVYRLTGAAPDRHSSMWTPTHARSHHTPDQFGTIVLGK
ncbi:MAG: carbohydrate-binding family 9-like protein [Bryobacteraceae bacterium]